MAWGSPPPVPVVLRAGRWGGEPQRASAAPGAGIRQAGSLCRTEPAPKKGGRAEPVPAGGSGPGSAIRRAAKKTNLQSSRRPGDLAVPGPKAGVGVRHALFPICTTLGASLSRAVCFPTLLSAASEALGLIAGPSRPFQARDLSSEASTPGSVTICRWCTRRTGAGTPARRQFAPAP